MESFLCNCIYVDETSLRTFPSVSWTAPEGTAGWSGVWNSWRVSISSCLSWQAALSVKAPPAPETRSCSRGRCEADTPWIRTPSLSTLPALSLRVCVCRTTLKACTARSRSTGVVRQAARTWSGLSDKPILSLLCHLFFQVNLLGRRLRARFLHHGPQQLPNHPAAVPAR